jgi:hypothetical protein
MVGHPPIIERLGNHPAAAVLAPERTQRVLLAAIRSDWSALQRAHDVISRRCDQSIEPVGGVGGRQQVEDMAAAAPFSGRHGAYGITSGGRRGVRNTPVDPQTRDA